MRHVANHQLPVETVIKSVKQSFQPSLEISQMMETFRHMVNDCIRIGRNNNTSTMKKLCNLAYKQLANYDIISYYKLCAITHAAGICYSKKVAEVDCASIEGVDRNLRNLTVGNKKNITQYDLSKAVDIADNTRSIIKSFKRNDVRIRRKLAKKYGQRRKRRINQLLHHTSKTVVQHAKNSKSAIAFEDIIRIRKLYQRGNHQGRAYRGRLSGWSFAEIKHQIGYKAAWEGVPIIQLSVKETRGTSQLCPRCGKKITQVDRRARQLWCAECKKWMDRDAVAAMNISIKGLAWFASSKGLAGEAMVQEFGSNEPIILKVDASKLSHIRHQPST